MGNMITNKSAIPLGLAGGLVIGALAVLLWAQDQHDTIKTDLEGKVESVREDCEKATKERIGFVQEGVAGVKEDIAEVKGDVKDIERKLDDISTKQSQDNQRILLLLMEIKEDGGG